MSFQERLMGYLGPLTRLEMQRHKALSTVNDFFILRADAEKLYQKSMERLASFETPELGAGSTLEKAFNEMKEDCEEKAKASKNYYENLIKDVLDPLQTLIGGHTTQLKGVRKSWSSNNRKYNEARTVVEELRNRYFKILADLEESLTNYETWKTKAEFKKDQRIKIETKIKQLVGEGLDSMKNYRRNQLLGQETRTEFIKFVIDNLHSYEKIEESRIDNLKKYLEAYTENNAILENQKKSKQEKLKVSIGNISLISDMEKIVEKLESKETIGKHPVIIPMNQRF